MVRDNGSCALSVGTMKVYSQFYGYPCKMSSGLINTTSKAQHVIKKKQQTKQQFGLYCSIDRICWLQYIIHQVQNLLVHPYKVTVHCLECYQP